jgi:hypothetical protein
MEDTVEECQKGDEESIRRVVPIPQGGREDRLVGGRSGGCGGCDVKHALVWGGRERGRANITSHEKETMATPGATLSGCVVFRVAASSEGFYWARVGQAVSLTGRGSCREILAICICRFRQCLTGLEGRGGMDGCRRD